LGDPGRSYHSSGVFEIILVAKLLHGSLLAVWSAVLGLNDTSEDGRSLSLQNWLVIDGGESENVVLFALVDWGHPIVLDLKLRLRWLESVSGLDSVAGLI
jgi:hypothetical protein